MGRIPSLSESGLLTTSQVVKSAPGYVFSITIAWNGATAGDLCYLRDGTDVSGAIEVAFSLNAAAGVITKEWPQGKKFDTGIYWDEGAAANLFVEMTVQ